MLEEETRDATMEKIEWRKHWKKQACKEFEVTINQQLSRSVQVMLQEERENGIKEVVNRILALLCFYLWLRKDQ